MRWGTRERRCQEQQEHPGESQPVRGEMYPAAARAQGDVGRSCFIHSRPVASSAQVEFHNWNLNKGGQWFSLPPPPPSSWPFGSPPSSRNLCHLSSVTRARLPSKKSARPPAISHRNALPTFHGVAFVSGGLGVGVGVRFLSRFVWWDGGGWCPGLGIRLEGGF